MSSNIWENNICYTLSVYPITTIAAATTTITITAATTTTAATTKTAATTAATAVTTRTWNNATTQQLEMLRYFVCVLNLILCITMI